MNKRMGILAMAVVGICVACVMAAESVAKVTVIEGTANFMRTGAKNWRPARPGMGLRVSDQLYAQAESFVEIRYNTGAVLRLDESTKITIEQASDKSAKTRAGVGQVWVNMKKMASSGRQFEISSPTATAAIRGTIFQMATAKDSSSDVSVYDGKVAVGPSDELKKEMKKAKSATMPGDPGEVPGPEEIPGPFEVPLETWKTIVAGQRISIRKDGMFAQEAFDVKTAFENAFVKKNQELDKKLGQE